MDLIILVSCGVVDAVPDNLTPNSISNSLLDEQVDLSQLSKNFNPRNPST
jgi:hypothetical protein